VPLAEIYPLVTARALARPFTYRVTDEVAQGDVVSIQFGLRTLRGVVVETGVGAPRGVDVADAGAVVDHVPAPLIELALWLADYYGSTPARALALVAPYVAKRRGARRDPAARDGLGGEPEPAELTDAQRTAVATISQALESGVGGHVLLHGPTGSGKTEVYLQAAAAVLARDRGVIVLVPEIALTPQTVGRFRARFGDDVAVLHSALTDAERRDERERIGTGEARIVVGARSAIFAPVDGLGLVVVDEEHDASFKQESDPRYDARTVAAKRAALEGAVAVYGSATPRAESWARRGRRALPARIGAPMPTVKLVDLRREAGYPLSAPLLAELAAVAERGGRAILLLNRRGMSGAVHCRSCGVTRRCRSCDIALTLHADARLHCHHPAMLAMTTVFRLACWMLMSLVTTSSTMIASCQSFKMLRICFRVQCVNRLNLWRPLSTASTVMKRTRNDPPPPPRKRKEWRASNTCPTIEICPLTLLKG
jgi:primosomal protein N' (replication factor Y)